MSTEFALLALARRRLKIATIMDLNDPFEFLAVQLDDARNRRAFRYFKERAHKDFGMLCFSEQWDDPVLWSHYGDKHRGIALGFDVPDLYATPVDYVPDRVVCARNAKGISREAIAKNHVTKFEHWAYERERRMFISLDPSTEENGLYFYDFGPDLTLREIIIGAESDATKEDVMRAAGNHHRRVTLSKARLAFKNFSVVNQGQFKKRRL